MKTTYHAYRFDTSKPDQKAAYKRFCAERKAAGAKVFCTWGGGSHYKPSLDGKVLTLEAEFIFENQWNTAPVEGESESGLRVFDWAEDYPIDFPKHIKRGHYLDITDEMRAARADRCKCGYCGAQMSRDEAAKRNWFHLDCLGSEHLEKKDLYLLRIRPVADECKGAPAPLTEEESAWLVPLYVEAQTTGRTERDKVRIANERAKIERERVKTIADANTKAGGLLWLMDHGISTANVIFYDHTGLFSFGWRKSLSQEERAELEKLLADFPYKYEWSKNK